MFMYNKDYYSLKTVVNFNPTYELNVTQSSVQEASNLTRVVFACSTANFFSMSHSGEMPFLLASAST